MPNLISKHHTFVIDQKIIEHVIWDINFLFIFMNTLTSIGSHRLKEEKKLAIFPLSH